MESDIIEELTLYADKFDLAYMRLESYEKSQSEAEILLKLELDDWGEIYETIETVYDQLKKELNASVFKANTDSQQYFYLGKVERFMKSIADIDHAGTQMWLKEFSKSFSDERILDIIGYLHLIVDSLDDIRDFIASHFQKSLILSLNSTKFPFLTGIVRYSLLCDNEITTDLEDPEDATPKISNQKLQWTCKPAVAGYIISELIRAGYLAPPTTGGEMSLNKLAGICNQLFDFKDHAPTVGSWRNVIDPERNTLPDLKRAKLVFPDLDQLT
ncbi:hypothetical protein J2I47_11850 [Fibrella sp. HMF5335]|uniref:Uncharacterized protein n=1 Tax=Fibrella rubiginis TaxID=2817060 RepID=A0A939K5H2_9BACT|nr:hypothetical protein [Fibrella rubiginis]MBO0937241.1 hypothetical protein [Fibrella rubiginis]